MPGPGTAAFDLLLQLGVEDFETLFAQRVQAALMGFGVGSGRFPLVTIPTIPAIPPHSLRFDPAQLQISLYATATTGNTAELVIHLGPVSYGLGADDIDLGRSADFTCNVTFGTVQTMGGWQFSVTLALPDPAPSFRPERTAELEARVGQAIAAQNILQTLGFLSLFPVTLPAVPLPVTTLDMAILRVPVGGPTRTSMAIGVSVPPPGTGGGDPAALRRLASNLPAMGADGTVTLQNIALFRAIQPLVEAAMGIPAARRPVLTPTTTRLFLPASAPATPAGAPPITWTSFSLNQPLAAGTAVSLAGSFFFSIGDATWTASFAPTTSLMLTIISGVVTVIPTVPPPTVVFSAGPLTIASAIITFGSLAALLGIAGLIVDAIIAALVAALVAAISVVIGSAAAGAISALSGPLLNLRGLLGGLGFTGFTPTWPVFLDDFVMGLMLRRSDSVATRLALDAMRLSDGEALDLDTGGVASLFGGPTASPSVSPGADLVWLEGATDLEEPLGRRLFAGPGARLVRINRPFDAVSHEDLRRSVIGASQVIPGAEVPTARQGSALPPPLVVGVRTDLLRYAKVALWQDPSGQLVLRFLCYDTLRASLRILASNPPWRVTRAERGPDTAGTWIEPPRRNYRVAHQGLFFAGVHQLVAPVSFTWALDGQVLSDNGRAAVGESEVGFQVNGDTCELSTEAGTSLSGELSCVAVDAAGATLSHSRPVEVNGERSESYGRSGFQIQLEAAERGSEIIPEIRWFHEGDPPPNWQDDRWVLSIDRVDRSAEIQRLQALMRPPEG